MNRKFNSNGITSRAPTFAESDFSLDTETQETVIIQGEERIIVVGAGSFTVSTNPTVDKEYTLSSSEITSLSFRSLDEGVATVDSERVDYSCK